MENKRGVSLVGLIIFIIIIAVGIVCFISFKHQNTNIEATSNNKKAVSENNDTKKSEEKNESKEDNIDNDTSDENGELSVKFKNNEKIYDLGKSGHVLKVKQAYGVVKGKNKSVIQNTLDGFCNDSFDEVKKTVETFIEDFAPDDAEYDIELTTNLKTEKLDDVVLSIKSERVGNLAGTSLDKNKGIVIDLNTGEELEIKDLAKSDYEELRTFINQKIATFIAEDKQVYDNFSESIDIDNCDKMDWYLSKEGLCLCFEKYYLTPETTVYTIKNDELSNYMKEDYLK